jgi:hypothetical protein
MHKLIFVNSNFSNVEFSDSSPLPKTLFYNEDIPREILGGYLHLSVIFLNKPEAVAYYRMVCVSDEHRELACLGDIAILRIPIPQARLGYLKGYRLFLACLKGYLAKIKKLLNRTGS